MINVIYVELFKTVIVLLLLGVSILLAGIWSAIKEQTTWLQGEDEIDKIGNS